MKNARRFLSLPLLALCTACAFFKPADHLTARQIGYTDLSGWQDDDESQALTAFLQSCPILAKSARPATSGSGLQVPASVWRSLCDEGARVPQGDASAARSFFESRFVPFRVANNGKESGLFTGYYEPVLYGAKRKQGDYIYPLYKAPADLASRKPYLSHEEINGGALSGKHLELVWVDDPVMRFFLQIQGSGRVRFTDGSEMQVGYDGQNGQAYESLGKIMGDQGLIPKDQINFFTIRQWLYDHPDEAFAMMQRNPSYVFFKRLDKPGAIGAVGAVLTPQRSLAVDNKFIPYGLPIFIETDLPALPQRQPTWFHRMLIAQDTGGAIRGPVRGDIFFGSTPDAEYLAGYMKGHGVYSLLVPKEIASQLQ